ncbi:MAG: hypothetical protein HYX67_14980 [Candidatus Melainabacteria bacterium]|nr:hypothetical protein [Candidatus Melainabacteria bacterium]
MNTLRRRRGQAISETGPALFVLLVMIFFPLLDVLAMGLQFCCSWYLNHEATHELAVSKFADWNTALDQIKQKFDNTGVPKFAHMVGGQHTFTSIPADVATGLPAQVNNKTSVTCKPFLNIPLFFPVAGVNQDITFSFTTVATWETYDKTDPAQASQQTQTKSFTE